MLLVFLLLAAWSSLAFAQARADEASRPMNILFISVDDLNDWIGVLDGYPGVKTPNFDRLAARGMLFTRAYSPAALCNPARTAILTGYRPSTTGIYVNDQPWKPLLPQAVALPRYFQENGFYTLGAGKIFHPSFPDHEAWDQHFRYRYHPLPPEVCHQGSDSVQEMPTHMTGKFFYWNALEGVDDAELMDHQIATWAADRLRLGAGEDGAPVQPFFMAVGLIFPHTPWCLPKKYFDLYPLEEIVLPESGDLEAIGIPAAGQKMAGSWLHRKMLKKDLWKQAVQAYLASITFADAQLGRVLDALDEGPYADNTIVVLWSDHGHHLGEKQHWRKHTLWEESIRVPLMFVVPGMTRPGQVCRRPVNLIDLYPTLLELAGLPPRADLDGISIVPLLEKPRRRWQRPALTTTYRGCHSVRSERWHYIVYEDGSEELYDHRNDPQEMRNLASDPGRSRVIDKLRAWLPEEDAPTAPKRELPGKTKEEINATEGPPTDG